MKLYAAIGKIVAAVVAIAGIAFLVYKYMDAIKAWMAKLCPCCEVELEEDFEVEAPVEEVVEEAPVEEVPAEDTTEEAPAEEAPVEEAPAEEAPAEEAPVADEADFEA